MFPKEFADGNLASDRRWGFLAFNVFWWIFGGVLMAARISANGWTIASTGLFVLFMLLLVPGVYGFALALTGWWVLRRGGDAVRINQSIPLDAVPDKLSPTAIIMPIFNEDVDRVFRGLRVMYESLQATGHGQSFDFFILSDSSDPNIWIAEEEAWFELCKQVDGFGQIFYRKRRLALHHKSGNVADFCRRWGSKYDYLIVLDADSIMSGQALLRLASLMECHPQVGIIQTFSRLALGDSLYQRLNQFASNVYGPLFVAGANYWQLDNATFYGHNAIIRIKPFMQYCAMPKLPSTGKLGNRIMSHDTVEAALIRRAGYEVWSDYDLEGSYEESPPHLPVALQRDRRWCHGNMQHLWFLFARGVTLPSRIHILIGILGYAGSPLWLLFLLFSPVLFVAGPYHANNSFLFACTMSMLLVPKFLGALRLISLPAKRAAVGGALKIFLSVVFETVYSMILAPILMLFYTQFVWSSFFGGGAGWGRQKRSDESGPSWRECVAAHLSHMLVAVAAGIAVAIFFPAMLPWLSLVLFGPIVAIPFSRVIASNRLGRWTRRRGWFLVPEEVNPPDVLKQLQQSPEPAKGGDTSGKEAEEDWGLGQTVLDPRMNAIHVSLLRERQQVPLRTHEHLVSLRDQLIREGPAALPAREKKILLWDADSMLALHQELWGSPGSEWHDWWQKAFHKFTKANE